MPIRRHYLALQHTASLPADNTAAVKRSMEGADEERTRFSSCRGVSFEIKTHDSLRPWFLRRQGTTGDVHPFPVHSFRSSSHPSSHFCDILGDDEDPENSLNSIISAATADPEKQQVVHKEKNNETRFSVILLDQGLFTVYKRLFTVSITLNLVIISLAISEYFAYAKRKAAAFAVYNVLVLTLCRSEAFLRIVFWSSVRALGRRGVPLWMKTATTSLLQSLGGVHSGCGVSSVAWLIYALVLALQHRDDTRPEIIAVASVILSLIFLSCLLAFPLVRHLHHNLFERTHRFAGWAALALLWVFVVLTAGYNPKTNSYDNLTATRLAGQQETWLTLLVTVLIVFPWITVRRVPVSVTSFSGHASIIKFSGGVKAGLLGRISRSPLSEWHAFGIISDNEESHMMLVGAVGDFTMRLVSEPPSHLWVRKVHFAGLPYLVNMYNRAVLVATGSGIAVFLSFLLQPCDAEVCLVWITKSVNHNFGPDIGEMMRGHPQGKVIIHDTAVLGRPNVAQLAVDTAKMWKAEVVVVTSNPQGSRDVVNACRAEGIAAYGPIWDS
ncbi:adenylate-forming reductase 06235-like [Wolffia australiana]